MKETPLGMFIVGSFMLAALIFIGIGMTKCFHQMNIETSTVEKLTCADIQIDPLGKITRCQSNNTKEVCYLFNSNLSCFWKN